MPRGEYENNRIIKEYSYTDTKKKVSGKFTQDLNLVS